MNVTPEFASPIGRRTVAQVARSAVVSSLADADPRLRPDGRARSRTSRPSRGAGGRGSAQCRCSSTPAPSRRTSQAFLEVADGCIVGSDLKVDGYTWNPVDRDQDRALRRGCARREPAARHRHRDDRDEGVLLDPIQGVVAEAERPMELHTPQPGWAEEDVDGVVGERLLAVPRARRPRARSVPSASAAWCRASSCRTRPVARSDRSIQQNDARAAVEIEELRTELEGDRVLERTGSAITQQSVGPTVRGSRATSPRPGPGRGRSPAPTTRHLQAHRRAWRRAKLGARERPLRPRDRSLGARHLRRGRTRAGPAPAGPPPRRGRR